MLEIDAEPPQTIKKKRSYLTVYSGWTLRNYDAAAYIVPFSINSFTQCVDKRLGFVFVQQQKKRGAF